MLKLDVDDYETRDRLYLQTLCYRLPRPFLVRPSSSGKGLHIAVPALDNWDVVRFICDDEMRVTLDEQRDRAHLNISNLLWDTKNEKPAGAWQMIRTEKDIEQYIDGLIGDPTAANTTIDIYIQRAKR